MVSLVVVRKSCGTEKILDRVLHLKVELKKPVTSPMITLCWKLPRSSHLARTFSRQTSATAKELGNLDASEQKELRDKAIAEALAKEEESVAKEKSLREMRLKTRDLVSTLNSTPSTLINDRLKTLQAQLDAIPDQKKVKQLDEEMEQFLLAQMKLPASEIQNRPWAKLTLESTQPEVTTEDGLVSRVIKTTTTSSYVSQFPNLKPTPDYKPYSTEELFLRQLAHTRHSGKLGSIVSDVYLPKDDIKLPTTIAETTIATLMAAGCHLGHAKASWRPSTQPFIYGEYDGIHLIDLNETLSSLKRASKVIKGVASKGGIILYVGTTKNWEQQRALEEAAKRSRGYFVSRRWVPGTITNFTEVTKQIGGKYKVEVDLADEPTNRQLTEEENRVMKPDLVVLLNPVENRNSIMECIKLRVPTIGLCDTDMEPSLLTYPVPCNDDSMRASSLILGILSKAAEAGVQERLNKFAEYLLTKKSLEKEVVQGMASIV